MRRVIVAGIALLMAGGFAAMPHLGSAQTPTAWSTFHGDRVRDGISTVSGTVSKIAANEFTVPPEAIGVPSSPVIDAKGVAYIGGGDGKVYAFDPATAATPVNLQYDAPKWTYQTGGGSIQSTPTLSNDGATLYIGSDDGNIYALSTADGHLIWKTPASLGHAIQASPLLSSDGSTLYVPNDAGTLYALNTSNGTVKFKYTGNAEPFGATSATLSPDGGTVYFIDGDLMYGIPAGGTSANQGATTFYLDGNGTSTPSVDSNGFIYVGTSRGILDSFTSTSGTPRWTFTVPGSSIGPVTSSPSFVNGAAVFGTLTGVYAVNQQSGQQVWHAPSATAVAVNSSPAVATGNSTIYVGSTDGNLYGLSAGGQVVFQRPAGAAVDASPAIAPDGSVWTISRSGLLDRLLVIAPPATIAPPTNTTTPLATNTPTITPTPVATSTPTPTPTATAVSLTVSLKSKVKDGQKQVITIHSAPNTVVHIRVNYPNGDHQSAKRTTNASGTVKYSYTQGASKLTHNKYKTTVIVTAGSGSAANSVSRTYNLAWGKIDVSAEPRKQSAGKVVDIFVHTRKFVRVLAYVLVPHQRVIVRNGRTGKKGLASIKVRVPGGLRKGTRVFILAKLKGGNPKIATKTFFTVK